MLNIGLILPSFDLDSGNPRQNDVDYDLCRYLKPAGAYMDVDKYHPKYGVGSIASGTAIESNLGAKEIKIKSFIFPHPSLPLLEKMFSETLEVPINLQLLSSWRTIND